MKKENYVTVDTKLITLIGTPLRQSFAARMQNAAYQAMEEPLIYTYAEADETHLQKIIDGIRYSPVYRGCAVTKPNKIKVMEYLDELDPLCKKTGACNTVMRTEDNRLIGYNTDAVGFRLSIENETDLQLKGINSYCMGAGGAGRAICFSLADSGAKKIYISDIFQRSAFDLVDDINRNFGEVAEYVPYGDYSRVRDCELVINASGIGMGKTEGQSPLPVEHIEAHQFYFDACYNPARTQFLLNAEERGCRVLNGLGMSLHQGAAQIRIWTGKEAPLEVMREELLRIVADNALNSIPLVEGKR